MKKFFTCALLITCFSGFSCFIYFKNFSNEVLNVISPTKFSIDLNNNKIADSDEIVCLADTEMYLPKIISSKRKFPDLDMALYDNDATNIEFLAKDFAFKTLLNKMVKLKIRKEYATSDCIYADIFVDRLSYAKLLKNNGFYASTDVSDLKKIKQNIENGRKLNLVVYNHHSNKYHKPDCKFAKLAHDTALIPLRQLPEGAIPCKYCHSLNKKLKHTKFAKFNKKVIAKTFVSLVYSDGDVKFYHTDFTKHLKPDTKCETSVCTQLVELINNAQEKIDIAIYGYDEVLPVNQVLAKAHARGVKIRFVYDEVPNNQTSYYTGNHFIKSLAQNYNSDKKSKYVQNIMHNKFVIVDDKMVYTGSMNFSKSGLSGYDQNDVAIFNSCEIAALYELEFEQMLSGKFHKDKLKHDCNNRFKIGTSIVEVYFSPQDNSSQRVVQLIKGSKKYIYAPVFLITHPEISSELIAAKKRGVDVRIIMDANNTATRNSKHKLLRNSGVSLKVENYAGKMHSKSMIIDDKYVIMGSMNFSNSGVNKNDENMLVIENSEFARHYKKFFLYLWNLIPDKYLRTYIRAEGPASIGSCSDGIDNNFDGKIDALDEACKGIK